MWGKANQYLNRGLENLNKQSNLTMEGQIFHTVCAVSIVVLIFNTFFDLFLDLSSAAILMFSIAVLVSYLYYLAKKGKMQLSIILYGILSNLMFICNYYLNSGIDGPTIMIFVLSIFMNIAVAPKKQYICWISLNILVVSSLLVIDYYHPGTIKNTYVAKRDRYLDMGVSYIITVLLILGVTIYIRKSYSVEKQKVELKALELENSNETKNKLFSILAHDLRAPLNSIQSYLEILCDLDLPEDEKKIIEHDLLSKTKNTSQMLSNLLIWTKAQMEGVTANIVSVNVTECLHTTIQIQQSLAKEKDIKIKNEIDTSVNVMADPDILQLVIRNLINNAIKFTPERGEIKISSEIKNNEVMLTVIDNGSGISLEQQKALFSFNTKPSYGTKNEKGVGLGLVLCKEFIELQKGEIWFLSEVGKGTTFFVNLKMAYVKQKESMAFINHA